MQATREHPELIVHVSEHTRESFFPQVDHTLRKRGMRCGHGPFGLVILEIPVNLHAVRNVPGNQPHVSSPAQYISTSHQPHTCARARHALQAIGTLRSSGLPQGLRPLRSHMQVWTNRFPVLVIGELGGGPPTCAYDYVTSSLLHSCIAHVQFPFMGVAEAKSHHAVVHLLQSAASLGADGRTHVEPCALG